MPASSSTASRRRQTRLRREYLYRRSLQGTEREKYEQKRRVRAALAAGQVLPTELRSDALRQEIDNEDTMTAQQRTAVDDEYAEAGLQDPRVCITTSRDPSRRLAQFAKELKILIPNTARINRGNHTVSDLMQSCKQQEFTDVMIVQETRGEPDGLIISHLPAGPTAYFSLSGAVLRHDLPTPAAPMSEAIPHVILHQLDQTELGRRVGTIWKCLFPPGASPASARIVALANQGDFLSFRHYMYRKAVPHAVTTDQIQLHEVGPRFELRLYKIRVGTWDQDHAANEYVLRPYQNTASKRNVL